MLIFSKKNSVNEQIKAHFINMSHRFIKNATGPISTDTQKAWNTVINHIDTKELKLGFIRDTLNHMQSDPAVEGLTVSTNFELVGIFLNMKILPNLKLYNYNNSYTFLPMVTKTIEDN